MELKKYQRNAIHMEIVQGSCEVGKSKFGGTPDLPQGFQWPYFRGQGLDGTVARRPLGFLVQLNCAELAPLDLEHRLPEKGMLYFFYELDSMKWGYDPQDKGCARVYYTEETNLVSTPFPKDLADWACLPQRAITFSQVEELPDAEEFELRFGEDIAQHPEDYAQYAMIGLEDEDAICHKLLGYANSIQGQMLEECELVSRGYNCGGEYHVTTSERLTAQKAAQQWNLLLQLDTVADDDFELTFGDSGRIYFYIRDTDLAARRFENAWLLLQCC